LKAKQVRGQKNKMFQVGDLIKYPTSAKCNAIPGLVVAVVKDSCGFVSHLEVQWFDWEPGELANENEEALVLVSSVRECKRGQVI